MPVQGCMVFASFGMAHFLIPIWQLGSCAVGWLKHIWDADPQRGTFLGWVPPINQFFFALIPNLEISIILSIFETCTVQSFLIKTGPQAVSMNPVNLGQLRWHIGPAFIGLVTTGGGAAPRKDRFQGDQCTLQQTIRPRKMTRMTYDLRHLGFPMP